MSLPGGSTLAARQHAFSQLFAPIAAELAAVDALLREELQNADVFVDRLVKHAFRLGGKRLRPALVLLAGQATGHLTADHELIAAVIEMIHTATLVHDDVLDQAAVRRHLETVNSQWDNPASVLLGDFLFSHAFYLASTLDSTFACRTIGRSTNRVCAGELRQINSRGNFDLREEEYLDIIDAKTAELCACACRLGAHLSAADEAVVDRLEQYGRQLGIAFQIVDDLLDLTGDESDVGKSLGTDLDQQKPTLPVIRLLQTADAAARAELLEVLHADAVSRQGQLTVRLEASDAMEYALGRAGEFAATARQQLVDLPASPARATLEQLTHQVLQRRS